MLGRITFELSAVEVRRMLELDGSIGEGGGQVLRTALAASLLTGRPFAIERIRAGRRRPGLRHQHLAAVHAACAISDGEAVGAAIDSSALVFRPGDVKPGSYRFPVGTAGSTGLVLQTILLPLLEAGASEVTIEGGTHNEAAPPFDFFDRAYLPLLRRMGAAVELTLERPGFYPAGGGRIRLRARPGLRARLELPERGSVRRVAARAIVSKLPVSIAARELAVVRRELGWPEDSLRAATVDAAGPGNVIVLVVDCEHVTEVVSGFGRRGLPAEAVAQGAVEQVRRYLAGAAPVGEHLADQLLLPLAWAGGGSFVTSEPSTHFVTNVHVLNRFFDDAVVTTPTGAGTVTVQCGA